MKETQKKNAGRKREFVKQQTAFRGHETTWSHTTISTNWV